MSTLVVNKTDTLALITGRYFLFGKKTYLTCRKESLINRRKMNIYLVLFKLDQQLVYEKFQRGHLHEMKLYDIVRRVESNFALY